MFSGGMEVEHWSKMVKLCPRKLQTIWFAANFVRFAFLSFFCSFFLSSFLDYCILLVIYWCFTVLFLEIILKTIWNCIIVFFDTLIRKRITYAMYTKAIATYLEHLFIFEYLSQFYTVVFVAISFEAGTNIRMN